MAAQQYTSQVSSAYSNPELFQLQLNQAMNSMTANILFGDEDTKNNAVFGDSSALLGSTDLSSIYGSSGSSNSLSDLFGSMGTSTSLNYIQLIAQAYLVGKNVEAINPETKRSFTGTVNSVSLDRGQVLIDIGGIQVPPEYLLKVTQ